MYHLYLTVDSGGSPKVAPSKEVLEELNISDYQILNFKTFIAVLQFIEHNPSILITLEPK